MSADLLAILIRATLAASAALIVILLMRRPLRAAFGAQVTYAFWLLAPIATLAAFVPARAISASPSLAPAAAPAATAVPIDAVQAQPTQPIMEMVATLPAEAAINLAPALVFIWFSGTIFSLLLLLQSHRRFMRNAGHAGPAVVGILRPRIVLPVDFEARYTAAERELVIAHERAHLAAFDAQINAFAALAQCLNWFNPLFHLARKALRVDQELACDARVMARHAEAKRIYAEAMLKTQLAAQPVPLGCAWPPIGAKPLKQRITNLSRPLPGARRTAFGSMLCLVGMGAVATIVWAAQPPMVAYADEQESSAAARALGRELVAALQENNTDQARELVTAGADVNVWVPGDGTPLVIAARRGEGEIVNLLIAHGADVNRPAPGDGNPLIMASAHGHVDIVELLVERGADVNGIVRGDETPLINAAGRNQLDVARYLIGRGADVNLAVIAPTIDGSERRSPLSMAQRRGHDEMARLLREHGATS